MTLDSLLENVNVVSRVGTELGSRELAGLDYDSRRIQPGFLFFAFPGAKADGRRFAQAALDAGALAIASELPAPEGFSGPWLQVEQGRQALSAAARNFYSYPDRAIALNGITGTNGKTTTGFLIDSVLRAAGKKTALIGTIEYHLTGQVLPAANTTPESLDICRLLDELRALGGRDATMEVSSHALALGRVHGFRFHSAVFTNLSQDHLDFHETMEKYFAAKCLLFQGNGAPPPKFAILNADDTFANRIPVDPSTQTFLYGLGAEATVRARHLALSVQGLKFDVAVGKTKLSIDSPLIGRVNVYNILAAVCVGLSHNLPFETITQGIADCKGVPGRFERVDSGQPFAIVVDYSHTDDALRNAIAVARSLQPARVITVFGCGGDRDRRKRPLMGQAAAEGSDLVILTSDNPRSEDPLAIMNDCLVGLRRMDTAAIVEPDRARAIRKALEAARPGDLVLIAGKGHETYQIFADRTIHFDDREVARDVLKSFGYARPANAD